MPKSMRRVSPEGVTMMLEGLMSLWMTPRRWISASVEAREMASVQDPGHLERLAQDSDRGSPSTCSSSSTGRSWIRSQA